MDDEFELVLELELEELFELELEELLLLESEELFDDELEEELPAVTNEPGSRAVTRRSPNVSVT